MADSNTPRSLAVNINGTWTYLDGIDSGAAHVNIDGTWRTISEVHVNVNGTWTQVFTNIPPGATVLSTRSFGSLNFNASWTNPSGVWQQEVKRRLQSAADTEGNYTEIHARSTTVRTSLSNFVAVGSVGDSMTNAVNGSTTNVQGPRYVYRVRNWDNFGHVSELQIDTLRGRVVSSLYVRSTDSATWRGTSFRTDSGVQAVDGGYTRCLQGYTSTGMNYGHHWYGGTGNGIVNNCFSNTLLPTCTAASWMGCRDAGGSGGTTAPVMHLHNQLSKGTTNQYADNGTKTGGTAQARESQVSQSIGTTNGGYFIAGTYKGIVIYEGSTTIESYGTSASYYIGYAHDEPQSSQYPGTLIITHTG